MAPAVKHAEELAAIVASYLRRHGFSKTIAAFLDENGGAIDREIDDVDLETLYSTYASTQPNGTSKQKKSKNKKILEDGLTTKEDLTDDGLKEAASEKKKHRKKKETNTAVDIEKAQVEGDRIECSNPHNGKEEPKKKSKKSKLDIEKKDLALEDGPKEECQTESAAVENGPSKKRKKEIKAQEADDALSHGNVSLKKNKKIKGVKCHADTVENEGVEQHESEVLSGTDLGLSKKKKNKSKDIGVADNGKIGNENDLSGHKTDITNETSASNGCELGSKKKKKKHKNDSNDVNGSVVEPTNAEVEEDKQKSKNVPVESEGGVVVNDLQEAPGSVPPKANKRKDTPGKERTPTGALAFKRVDPEKVTFSDPRLTDNSYWAKDGADEGYGAKAQEVLGQVRGRDFRHEKTKKKRGSYRGGLIGLQSHSIKFENSDDDE